MLTKRKAGFGSIASKMGEKGRKRRGPYLQFLADGSHQNVPRTTKYRWQKKMRTRTVDTVSCESDVPEDPEPLNIDCSIEDVVSCTHPLQPVVASSSLDKDCMQESDAFAFTDRIVVLCFLMKVSRPHLKNQLCLQMKSGRSTKPLHLLTIFLKKLEF